MQGQADSHIDAGFRRRRDDMLPSILTLKEVSKELRCSKAHLSHIVNGKVAGLPPLPVARIGRRVIIRREALLNWLWTVEGRDGIMASDLNSSFLTHGKE